MTNHTHRIFDSSPEAHSTLVLGFDFSDCSELALEQCFSLVHALPSVTLHVVWIARHPLAELEPYTQPVDYKALAEHLKHHIGERARALQGDHAYGHTRVEIHVTSGDPATTINDVAFFENADLIVVGTHGRMGIERFLLGSVAADVLATAPCPVLIARPHAADLLPIIEPPRAELATPTLGKRHTYHAADRNTQARENMPLLFPF